MNKPKEKNGIVLFDAEGSLLLFNESEKGEHSFSAIEHGMNLLSSCSEINHFAVVVAPYGEQYRRRIENLIEKNTSLNKAEDFGVYLIPEEFLKEGVEPIVHFKKIVEGWVEHCEKQNTKPAAGVSKNADTLDYIESLGVPTVKCDESKSEIPAFRFATPEERQAHEATGQVIEGEFSEGEQPDSYPEQEVDEESELAVEPELVRDTPRRKDKSPDWQSDPIFKGDPAIEQAIQFPQYWKKIPSDWEFVDIYRVDELFPIELPGSSRLYHARKKLMIPGVRTGGKPAYKDIQEAVATLQGWLRDHAPRSDA